MSEGLLIDASNLHAGGGVQVAASFLDELAELLQDSEILRCRPWLRRENMRIEISTAVSHNLREETLARLSLTLIDRTPRTLATWLPTTSKHNVRFTVFGPAYGPKRARSQIIGFADITSLFPELVPASDRRWRSRAQSYVRRRVSRFIYRRANHVVVEAPVLVDELRSKWRLSADMISVVSNTINRRLVSAPHPVGDSLPDGPPSFCYVSRGYPHKNFAVLANVNDILQNEHNVGPVRFVFTLTEAEWGSLPRSLRLAALNVGPVEVSRLPEIYAGCDGSVFPSKLEAFSVTPLEVLAMGIPLIASDRPFVRDVVGSAATYADPDDPKAWASAIAEVLAKDEAVNRRVVDGLRLVHNWPDARDRAMEYLAIIEDQLNLTQLSSQ